MPQMMVSIIRNGNFIRVNHFSFLYSCPLSRQTTQLTALFISDGPHSAFSPQNSFLQTHYRDAVVEYDWGGSLASS